MDEDLSLYGQLKLLVEIERQSGTSCLYSPQALRLLEVLDSEVDRIDRAIRSSNYDEESRAGYADAARSEACDMWNAYQEFYENIIFGD